MHSYSCETTGFNPKEHHEHDAKITQEGSQKHNRSGFLPDIYTQMIIPGVYSNFIKSTVEHRQLGVHEWTSKLHHVFKIPSLRNAEELKLFKITITIHQSLRVIFQTVTMVTANFKNTICSTRKRIDLCRLTLFHKPQNNERHHLDYTSERKILRATLVQGKVVNSKTSG